MADLTPSPIDAERGEVQLPVLKSPCQQSGAASSPAGQSSIRSTATPTCEREVSMMAEVRERMIWVQAAALSDRSGDAQSVVAERATPRLSCPLQPQGGLLMCPPSPGPSTPFGTWSESPSEQAANAAIMAPVFPDAMDFGCEDVSPKRTVSFRSLVVSVNMFIVLLTCALMYTTIEHASASIQDGVIHSCRKAMDMQQVLVDQLVYRNITDGSFRSKIRSGETMVQQLIQLPADRAAHALWGSLRTMRHVNASWREQDPSQLQRLAYRSWAELERPWNMTSPGWGGVRSRHAPPETATEMLSVTFFGGESAGFQISHQGTSCPAAGSALCGECEGWCTWSTAETFTSGSAVNGSTTVTYRATDPATGRQLHVLGSKQRGLGAQTPGVSVQLRQMALAQAMPGGAASFRARPLWSNLYTMDGIMRFSWTIPISPCGNYSCLEGVVEAGVTLRGVSWHCAAVWEKLKMLLASSTYNFHIGNQNSSLFIVHITPESSLEDMGVLIGTSDAYPINSRIRAENASQDVVRATARALLARFASWNASELVEREHLLAFRRHPAMDWKLEECVPTSQDMQAQVQDCQQVGTRAVSLDERTWWLVVASLPAGAFTGPATDSLMMADEEVSQLHGQSQQEIHRARVVGAIVIILIAGTSVGLGFGLGCLVSEPLRRLSSLMQQLGGFDFSKDSAELRALSSGRYACIANVRELQGAFCRLLGGIEAFTRFVPETVVTRIVCGDRRATRLHVDKRDVTTMFSTIAGFSELSEVLSEHDLARVLTAFHTVMTEVVERHEGAVAEILDNGLLVYWNAPDNVPGHAGKACRAALAQQSALRLLNEELATEGLPQLAIHAGLHTGRVLSGNIGSTMKMKFGCMGDSVNLSSRLNGLCKYYGVSTVCSGATHSALPRDSGIFCRQLDLVQVKGRQTPTLVYELVGHVERGRDDESPQESDMGAIVPEVTEVPSYGSTMLKTFTENSALGMRTGSGSALASSSATSEDRFAVVGHGSLLAASDHGLEGRDEQQSPCVITITSSSPAAQEPARSFSRLGRLRTLLGHAPSLGLPARGRTAAALTFGAASPSAVTFGRSCISEPDVRARRLDPLGRSPTLVTPSECSHARRYEEALRHFQQANFPEAALSLEALLEERPSDKAARILLQRTSRLGGRRLSQEELADWTGVNSMKEK